MSFDRISQTIDRALSAAGLLPAAGQASQAPAADGRWSSMAETLRKAAGSLRNPTRGPIVVPKPEVRRDGDGNAAPLAGQFLDLSFANARGGRAYKLFIPADRPAGPAPLIVMLHGCKQHPVDFAAGTRMNELAQRHGFLVAYPEQTARENGGNCWNWFEGAQQSRDGTEPSILSGLVGDIVRSYDVDPSRVYVAGLSAGAAMAVILGATYPEVFAGVAAHSGLAAGAASDVASAFAAMHGRPAPARQDVPAVATFVIHGSADSTVLRSNGTAIVEQAARAHERSSMRLARRERPPAIHGGRTVAVTEYVGADGARRIEEWVVDGGAHTWFGGSAQGSFTDASGPDASAEIVRFFLDLKPRPAGAAADIWDI